MKPAPLVKRINWIIKQIIKKNKSIGFNPKKKIKKNSWLISLLSILNKMILKIYPKDFEIKGKILLLEMKFSVLVLRDKELINAT